MTLAGRLENMEKLYLVIVLIVVLMMLMQFGLVWRMRKQVGKTAPDLRTLIGRAPAAKERVLVYFYSDYCHACKPMTPLIKNMQTTLDNVLSINISEQPQMARDFGITATPTIAVVGNNKICAIRAGTLNQNQINKLLMPEKADD